ncbi:MAG: anion transporter, partial [Planctomycetes bacterium]|nr:anion transporter [Planctomycetota bacterium]
TWFVVVGGVGKVNVLRDMHDAVTPFLGGSPGEQMAAFGAFTVVGSNVVSNVPFVLVACDWVKSFAHPALMWYVLAVASTFAGNLTIVGSVANIIVMEQAKERVTIGFLAYLRAGLPITLATTVVGLALLWAGAALGVPL